MASDLKRLCIALLALLICEFAVAAAATTTTTPPLAKPGCKDYCGAVPIPYPFGIGRDCYENEWFEIVCNTTADPPVPFLASIQREVLNFALGDNYYINGQVRRHYNFDIQSPVMSSSGCPDQVEYSSPLNLTGSPFFISMFNQFTAVGCNNKALLTGTGSQIVGCEAKWENEALYNQFLNKCCIGYRCCQTAIPPYLQVFKATVDELDPNKTECQVAYLTRLHLSPFIFTPPEPVEYKRTLSMALEWYLEDISFTSDDSFECKILSSTTLMVADVLDAYQCWCAEGYTGNPYLPGGCQDIDECRYRGHLCGGDKCVNVRGSYRCEKTWPAILGGSLGSGLLLLFAGMWWLYRTSRKRRAARQRKKFFKRNGGLLLEQQTTSGEGGVQKTKLFSSKQLEKATDKFNASRVLGQGGQGTVYKGMLTDGRIVAVKKSKAVEKENLEEFINEFIILSQINHRNVVQILGCCLETEVPVLVYEFIPNSNLFEHLHNPSEDYPLTWEVRLRIATEAANALSYLHSAASIPIYHRDVKSTNILLDEKYCAKVSDFGISRSVPVDQTHLTTIVQGTIGYVDPEYLQSSRFTEKSDVYSFGVVLVELLTGEKPVSLLRPEEGRLLAAHFLESMRQNKLQDIVDARIKEECDRHEVTSVANLARRCLSFNSESRPTMRDVSTELERIQSLRKGTQAQAQNGEELGHIRIDLQESLALIHTSPNIRVDNCPSRSGAELLVPHRTW